MKVIVCGGRNYNDKDAMLYALGAEPITHVIHGGAPGADTLAGQYAKEANIPCTVFKADWSRHGKAAGPIRNQQMLDEGKPDMVIAFPGGRGTRDMILRARAAGVEVLFADVAVCFTAETFGGK